MPKSSRFLVVVMLLVFCLAPATASASDPVHWGYEGEIGPPYWGTLSPDYAACGAGKEQSPVDIPTGAVLNPADLKFNYQPSSLNIANNGHSIQVNYDAGSALEAGGVSWPLTQFHLHSLSEHTLAGAQTPMELHLVHKDAKGRIAVVGVMLVEGAQNEAYQPVLANMPAQAGGARGGRRRNRGRGEPAPNRSQLLPLQRLADDPPVHRKCVMVRHGKASRIVRGADRGLQGTVRWQLPAGAADERSNVPADV